MTFFMKVSLVSHILHWQNLACQLAKMNLLWPDNWTLKQRMFLSVFMLSWTFHFLRYKGFIPGGTLYFDQEYVKSVHFYIVYWWMKSMCEIELVLVQVKHQTWTFHLLNHIMLMKPTVSVMNSEDNYLMSHCLPAHFQRLFCGFWKLE